MRSSSLVVTPGTAASSSRSRVSTTMVQARCIFWSSAQDFWTLTPAPPRCRCRSPDTASIGPEAVDAVERGRRVLVELDERACVLVLRSSCESRAPPAWSCVVVAARAPESRRSSSSRGTSRLKTTNSRRRPRAEHAARAPRPGAACAGSRRGCSRARSRAPASARGSSPISRSSGTSSPFSMKGAAACARAACPGGDGVAQHVPGGDARHAQALGQPRGLRALPRARRAEEDDARRGASTAASG